MKINKITEPNAEEKNVLLQLCALPENEIPFTANKVQGANIYQSGKILYAKSPKRYKLFTDNEHVILFLNGSGHFKWARGEIDFSKGDSFTIENVGEYEVNGNCTFAVYRK